MFRQLLSLRHPAAAAATLVPPTAAAVGLRRCTPQSGPPPPARTWVHHSADCQCCVSRAQQCRCHLRWLLTVKGTTTCLSCSHLWALLRRPWQAPVAAVPNHLLCGQLYQQHTEAVQVGCQGAACTHKQLRRCIQAASAHCCACCAAQHLGKAQISQAGALVIRQQHVAAGHGGTTSKQAHNMWMAPQKLLDGHGAVDADSPHSAGIAVHLQHVATRGITCS